MIKTKNLVVSYSEKQILKGVDFEAKAGEIITIIGPNGSGKTTLVKALSRSKATESGLISLGGEDIKKIPTRTIARQLAVLPQNKHVPLDMSVEALVSYGRHPHLNFTGRLSPKDMQVIDWALEKTGLLELRSRFVGQLSGGERQRAWIALALAQEPKILILDEPTTYLDIGYQLEILELIKELNRTLGLTVIMVLHDINQAARYSHRIYVLKEGRIFSQGSAREILNAELLGQVFKAKAEIYEDEINSCPYFIACKLV